MVPTAFTSFYSTSPTQISVSMTKLAPQLASILLHIEYITFILITFFSKFSSGSRRSSFTFHSCSNFVKFFDISCTDRSSGFTWDWFVSDKKIFGRHTKIFAGAAGVGGNMVAQTMCLAPAYCRSRGGQCCLVVVVNGRITCPARC